VASCGLGKNWYTNDRRSLPASQIPIFPATALSPRQKIWRWCLQRHEEKIFSKKRLKTIFERSQLVARKSISYAGKVVYIGIDVHKATYSITCICNGVIVKKATIKALPLEFAASLLKWFEGATIKSAYEAGFSGFALHRILCRNGITNIVVNPASIAIAANDRVKTDPRDSEKIADQLSVGQLIGIYVPTPEEEYRRALTRTREQIVEKRSVAARQIKSKLHYFGFMAHDDKRMITNRYLNEIVAMKLPTDLAFSFALLGDEWRYLTKTLIGVRAKLQEQAKKDSHLENIYRSVPGIGPVTARVLANELGNMARFPNEKALFHYLGLTPSEHSSGDNIRRGHISRQGSGRLRAILVEAAWRAIGQDPALKEVYERVAKTRGGKRAIVGVARKLIGRIRACFRTGSLYAIETYA
jgi:transposase